MKYAIITDTHVEKLYGHHLKVPIFSFPAGEASKTRKTKEELENRLLENGFSRETTLIALGGGVVTDLVGFLASTFCRGVDLILIPTTLLAMVDAAIGGKTAVNTEYGKNLIGTFYPPKSVLLNFKFLETLPEKEWFNGHVEMLKAALLADEELFYNFSTIPLTQAIHRAIEIKRRIVALDPFEKGVRKLLNLGHTMGHALETVSNYQLSHGEAVAHGIVLESRIAHELGILTSSILDQIEKRLPPVTGAFDLEKILQVLTLDKKGAGTFILLRDIADPVEMEVPIEVVTKVLHDAALCPR